MIPSAICALAFLSVLIAARRSIGAGVAASVTVGYAYGIVRANFLSTPTYLLFDFAVFGLYLGAGRKVLERISNDQRTRQLATWAFALILWPAILFFVPGYDPMLQMVGLRGNAFLLPFLLIGAVATETDLRKLAVWLSVLNILVFGLAVAEFISDVRLFYPLNAATRLIYMSNDVAGYTAYRIPASFVNAHAFAGTMVMTLPILLGGFNRGFGSWWRTALSYGGIGAALVGVFMAATRTHVAALSLVAAVVILSGALSRRAVVSMIVAVASIGFVVMSDVRLQRFTSLTDAGVVQERFGWSVNDYLVDVVSGHPLGNGLAGGGTSVPSFVEADTQGTVLIENEYGRIAAEQGTVGLLLWVALVVWFTTRVPQRRSEPWFLGRLAAWAAVVVYFFMGLIGTGLLTSIPQSGLMLLLAGWVAVPSAPAEKVVLGRGPVPRRAGWRTRNESAGRAS